MEFRLSAEQVLFKQMVREYCEKNIEPRAREIDEEGKGIPEDIIQGLADLGIFGMVVPDTNTIIPAHTSVGGLLYHYSVEPVAGLLIGPGKLTEIQISADVEHHHGITPDGAAK